MLSEKIENALNLHVNFEMFSANFYLSMSAYFNSIDLPGFAQWMRVQFDEEMFHAMKFYDFIDARDGRVLMGGIESPKQHWDSALDAFEETLAHERLVSSKINELVTMALSEQDHMTNNFLQWFVMEQVEEESTVKGIVQKLKMASKSPSSMLMIDAELSKRVFVPPAK